MTFQRYHKSQNLTKKQVKICRFLPEVLCNLVVVYLAQVRVVEMYFLKKLGHKDWNVGSYQLLMNKGEPLSAEKIRHGFKSIMRQNGIQMCLSGYR